MFAKYVPPVVANGKVYVPNFGPVGNTDGSGNLVVYGLLQSVAPVDRDRQQRDPRLWSGQPNL